MDSTQTPTPKAAGPTAAAALPCPLCGHALHRIPRLFLDRLLSKVAARRRYRCTWVACGWEGTQRHGQGDEEERIVYRIL